MSTSIRHASRPESAQTETDSAAAAAEQRAFEKARRSRDARFDGRFFVGVHSTGIYCRPICPAPPAKASNVRYYPSAAAAASVGLRPCLRCRPEAAPGTPAWMGTATTVRRALRLIDEGALDDGDVNTLAGRLGVGERHLRRLFLQHLGASPIQVAGTRRLHFARRLLLETDLLVAEVAFAAGFGSVRRFNAAFRAAYSKTPSSLRQCGTPRGGEGITLRLAYRPPFDFERMLAYLEPRAIPGIEEVVRKGTDAASSYRRTVRLAKASPPKSDRAEVPLATMRSASPGARVSTWLEVRQSSGDSLAVTLHDCPPAEILGVVRAVRRLFDLDADPALVSDCLASDPLLGELVASNPDVRVPGAVDRFETAVRVILGQQVTVRGATTLAGQLVALYGDEVEPGRYLFPSAARLASAELDELGMPRSRIRALGLFAAAVASGEIDLSGGSEAGAVIDRIVEIPGLGPWTAQVIALRCLHQPDVFPAQDLGLRQVLAARLEVGGAKLSPARIDEIASSWSPWRSYAAMLLWRAHAASVLR